MKTLFNPKTFLAFAAVAMMGVFSVSANADIFMYHDFGANSVAQASAGNITTHQIGSGSAVAQDLTVKSLINYADGLATGATFQITTAGSAMDGRNGGEYGPPPAATPADAIFNVLGLNLNNGSLNAGGPSHAGVMVFTLTGLKTNATYDLALFGNRIFSSDGLEQFTLGGASSAINSSSSGIVSTFVTNSETRKPSSTGNGDVIRWTAIDPGLDGTVTVTINPEFSTLNNIAYLSAMRLVEISPVPEPSSIALLGLGVAVVLGRRSRRNV